MAMKICRTPVITSIAPANVMGPLAHGETACRAGADRWLIEAPLPGSGHSVRRILNARPSAPHRPGQVSTGAALPGLPGVRRFVAIGPCGDPALGGLQLRDGEPAQLAGNQYRQHAQGRSEPALVA